MHIIKGRRHKKSLLPWTLPKLPLLPTFSLLFLPPKVETQFFARPAPRDTLFADLFFLFKSVKRNLGSPPPPAPPHCPRGRVFFSGTCSQTIIITTLLLSLLWYKWPEKLCFGKKYAFTRLKGFLTKTETI